MFSRALAGTGVAIFSTSLEGGRGILGRTLRSCGGTLRWPRVPTGVTWTLFAGQGALLALQVWDLGHHVVTLVPCWVGWGEFAGHPLACNPCLPFSSRPLNESSRLADPYTPVIEGSWVLDFDHPPKFCATPGVRVPSASWGPLFIKPYPN